MTGPDPSSTLMPGGGLSRRPLHFLILADRSGGMAGEKMQSLNFAIADMLSHLKEWERDQMRARVLVRALGFATDVQWHVQEPVAVSKMSWRPMEAVPHGWSNMAKAFSEVARVLAPGRLEDRALRPAVILVTDGRSTDEPEDFDAGLRKLMDVPAGRDALRLAVAIGRDAVRDELVRFIGDPRVPVMLAEDTDQIGDRLVAASSGVSNATHGAPDPGAVPIRTLSAQIELSGSDRETIV